MLLGPDVPPWQMRWARSPGIAPPDTVRALSTAIPMVAPVPTGASDNSRNTQPAQKPLQALSTSTNQHDSSAYNSALAGIISAANTRLAAKFTAAKPGTLPPLNDAKPQGTQHRTATADYSRAAATFVLLDEPAIGNDPGYLYDPAYRELILNAVDEEELASIDNMYAQTQTPQHNGGLDNFATFAEALAYINNHASEEELIDHELDSGQIEIETSDDFEAAQRLYTTQYDAEDAEVNFLDQFATAAEALAWVNDPANEEELSN